jgi:hypothetical protein
MDFSPRSLAPAAESLEPRIAPATINLASPGAADITLVAADAFDISGSSVSSAGDFNGDGFDDFLIGAPGGDRPTENLPLSGETYIIFGGPRFPKTIDLGNLGTAGITIFGAGSGNLIGNTVSGVGDVNNDGFDDIVIGGRSIQRARIIFGGPALPATIDLASPGVPIVSFVPADSFDLTISMSGAGDVNNDGFDDLLIGAFEADAAGNAKIDAGETYLIFGAASLPATIDLGSLGAGGTTIFGAEAGDQSGTSVSAAGDVNDDGFDDFLIGAPFASGPGNIETSAGETYLILGAASFPASIDLAVPGSVALTILGADAMDFSGTAVSDAGDVNRDGFPDILIGAPGADGAGKGNTDTGESYIVFGAISLPASIDLANLGSAGVVLLGAKTSAKSGTAVSGVGDLNGDGFADVIVGAPLATAGTNKIEGGESHVVFGGATLPASVDLSNLGTAGFAIVGASTGEQSGSSVSRAGDINGDGFDDLIVGAARADPAGVGRDGGRSYVLLGAPPGKTDPNAVIVRDVDGDVISLKLAGARLSLANIDRADDGSIETIDLTRFAALAGGGKVLNLTVSVKTPVGGAGDGSTRIGMLNADGVRLGKVKLQADLERFIAGKVNAKSTTVKSITLTGALGLRDLVPFAESQDATESEGLPIGDAISQIRGGLGKLVVGGDFTRARLEVTENVGSVTLRGAVLGSQFSAGKIASIRVIGALTSDNPADPAIFSARKSIGRLVIEGDVTNARILIGYDKTGAPVNSDAALGTLMVKGNWSASSIAVGIDDSTGDGFGRNDTVIDSDSTPKVFSRIARIVIEGTALGSSAANDHFGITAQKIGSLTINDIPIPLQQSASDDILLDTTNTDFRLVELS